VGTSVLQVLIVEFGGNAMHVSDGLPANYWAISLILGAGALPVQQVINVIFGMVVKSKRRWRQNQRYKRDRELAVKHTNGMHLKTE
jgi:Ca2+ transporting ATPase